VISRKDIDHLEERHILHSLSIAMKFRFGSGTRIMDVGTGGGFPGIPLAILFPESAFILVDSITKKIRLVEELVRILELKNVSALNKRMEQLQLKTDFVVSRAVAPFPKLYRWTQGLIEPGHRQNMSNGLISLKGGDLESELIPFRNRIELIPISNWFREPFFSTKMIVYLKK
jgi:16S rRNA (guanine527-N7)-methyltransferase